MRGTAKLEAVTRRRQARVEEYQRLLDEAEEEAELEASGMDCYGSLDHVLADAYPEWSGAMPVRFAGPG